MTTKQVPRQEPQPDYDQYWRLVDRCKPATSVVCQKNFKSKQKIRRCSRRSRSHRELLFWIALARDKTIFKNMPNYPTAPSPSATRHWPCEDCHAASALIARSRVSSATLHFQKPYFLYHSFLKPMSLHGAWVDPACNPFRC